MTTPGCDQGKIVVKVMRKEKQENSVGKTKGLPGGSKLQRIKGIFIHYILRPYRPKRNRLINSFRILGIC
jgi:hypothetical protein